MRSALIGANRSCAAVAFIVALLMGVCLADATLDQQNSPQRASGAVSIPTKNRVGQSFVPRLPWLSSIEVALIPNSATVKLAVIDPVTKKILVASSKTLTRSPVPGPILRQKYTRFDLPGGGIAVKPGKALVISLQSGTSTNIEWRFANGNPYHSGAAIIHGLPSETADFLFKTWGTNPPVWTFPVETGNWVNWVSISGDGGEVLGGSFHFSSTTTFGVYCLNNTGAPAKWSDVLHSAYDGVFWTAVSQDGSYGAVGGLISKSPYHGFVRIYNMQTGTALLNELTEERVNVVAVTNDGSWVIAADGGQYSQHSTLRVYQLQASGGTPTYVKTDEYDSGSNNISTAAISQDGKFVVIGSANKQFNPSKALVKLFSVVNGKLTLQNTWQSDALYVEFVDTNKDGSVFAAALQNGQIAAFESNTFPTTGVPSWTSQINGAQPALHSCGGHNVYGVRVSSDGTRVVAGSNCSPDDAGGNVDMFSNPPKLDANGHPTYEWTFHTNRPVNPGVSMDGAARYVAVADGHPLGTRGNFYLLDATTGRDLWNYQSGDMSWPIALSFDGKYVVGGSDDGKIYFWKNY